MSSRRSSDDYDRCSPPVREIDGTGRSALPGWARRGCALRSRRIGPRAGGGFSAHDATSGCNSQSTRLMHTTLVWSSCTSSCDRYGLRAAHAFEVWPSTWYLRLAAATTCALGARIDFNRRWFFLTPLPRRAFPDRDRGRRRAPSICRPAVIGLCRAAQERGRTDAECRRRVSRGCGHAVSLGPQFRYQSAMGWRTTVARYPTAARSMYVQSGGSGRLARPRRRFAAQPRIPTPFYCDVLSRAVMQRGPSGIHAFGVHPLNWPSEGAGCLPRTCTQRRGADEAAASTAH